jgi:hypothetical protein
MTLVNVDNYGRTVDTNMGPVIGYIISAPVTVVVMVMPVIMVIPVIMIPVIIVPVVGSPWTPIRGIISIVPVGPPNRIPGVVNIPDDRPASDFIIGGGDHIYIFPVGLPGIARIRRFGIDWFNDIVRSVQCFIPDQLDLNRTVP